MTPSVTRYIAPHVEYSSRGSTTAPSRGIAPDGHEGLCYVHLAKLTEPPSASFTESPNSNGSCPAPLTTACGTISPAIDQRLPPGSHLRTDCARLHHGLWRAEVDQLRARRCLHAGRVCGLFRCVAAGTGGT